MFISDFAEGSLLVDWGTVWDSGKIKVQLVTSKASKCSTCCTIPPAPSYFFYNTYLLNLFIYAFGIVSLSFVNNGIIKSGENEVTKHGSSQCSKYMRKENSTKADLHTAHLLLYAHT